MSKPNLSITPKLTPEQAIGIIAAIEDWQRDNYGPSARWRSIFNGARRQIEAALIDAGWKRDADNKGFHRRG